jgi:hypothetical protein
MRERTIPQSRITGLEDINFRISSFINTFTNVLFVVEFMTLVGVLMKVFRLYGGNYVFIFSVIVLTLMFLVQIGLSFFYIVSHVKLALLGAFGSLALALGFMAVLFRFQHWLGWQVMFIVAIPIFLVTAYFLGRYIYHHEKLHHNQLHFLNRNLLFPYLLVLGLGIAGFWLDRYTNPPKTKPGTNTPVNQPADSSHTW